MKEQKITFETAKLANSVGLPGLISFPKTKKHWIAANFPYNQSLVQKWLREQYCIIAEPLIFDKGSLKKDYFCYQWRVYNDSDEWFTNGVEYHTYEDALEEALRRGLKFIQKG